MRKISRLLMRIIRFVEVILAKQQTEGKSTDENENLFVF